jgi:hypothetical protein
VVNRYVGNLPPMPGVFPDYPAPVLRNADDERELIMMRWGMPPPPRTGGPPVTNIRNTSSPLLGPGAFGIRSLAVRAGIFLAGPFSRAIPFGRGKAAAPFTTHRYAGSSELHQ